MSILSAQLQRHYDGKKILILGWGREGQSTYQTLQKYCDAAQIFVSDQDEQAVNNWQNETHQSLATVQYLQQLGNFDAIFKSPGIPLLLPELESYVGGGGLITSQLNEFLLAYRDQTIGVTGTKGKSTTSSLISTLCQAAGKKTLLAGNIGTPVFDIAEALTEDTQVVLEMSSYQLESVHASPHVAVMLNFFAEHLNYHQSLGNYLAAKAKITTFQTADDTLIFNQDSPELESISLKTAAKLVPFSYNQELSYPETVQHALAELERVQLPATIKKWNVLPALLATDFLSLDVEQVVAALQKFQPLPHRLQTVSKLHDITWIDDTLATIPEATMAALESLPQVDVLILGGYDRGISYQKIVDAVIQKKVSAIAFFKPSGQTMYDLLRQNYPESSWPQMQVVESMEEAVNFAYDHAPKNGVVLLSPSSPSFGQFKNYEDKSVQFLSWIEKLASENS